MGVLLKSGRTFDHNGKTIEVDILIEDGRIVEKGVGFNEEGHRVMDCSGKWVLPGFVDLHVHLREPGFEEKETIETGSQAAVKGGFTTIACMPNTKPVLDHEDQIRFVREQAERNAFARVLPIGAISVRQLGKELTDFEALQRAGVMAVSDDGVGVQSSRMMKEAMLKAQSVGLPVIAHCEDNTLLNGGCVHEGGFARKHGLRGIPSESESIHVGRDLLLAEKTGVHYHVCHVSTKESVRLIRAAKKIGVHVTAEVTPHHLLLSEDDIPGPDPNFKMNPPLRSQADKEALIEGLLDGTLDFIATDHAPHTAEEKSKGIERAPFGIVGLETAFPLLYTYLVQTGVLSLYQLVQRITEVPAQRFGLPYGTLRKGSPADITIVDLDLEKEIDPQAFASKGKNTPFGGWKCKGWPTMTLINGEVVWTEKDGFAERKR